MTEVERRADEGPASIREYLSILRARKWSILGVTALVLASALFFSLRQIPVYEASARVLVKPLSSSASSPLGAAPPNLETERGLAASVPVAQRVTEELDLPEDPQSLLGSLEVEVVPSSEFLLVNYQHTDPVEAQRRAQAFAEGYLDYRRDQAVNDVLAAAETVSQRIETVQEQLAEVEEEFRGASPSEELQLGNRSSLLLGQLAVLQEQLSGLTPSNISVGQIVEPAALPSTPASPNYPLNGGMAIVFGLALGMGIAFLRERLDDRLRGRQDLEVQAGAPVLAVIPKVGTWKKKNETPVISMAEPKSAPSEAYRTLRTALTFLSTQQGIKTVLVTSPHPNEGKTATVANLAVSLAQAGKRVVAISGDLRKPRLHRFFGGQQNGAGLTNVLAGEANPIDSLTRPGLETLRLLGSGPIPGNPNELLGSDRMGDLVDQLRAVSDFVLIDSAPVLAVADALTLAAFADAVLLVADAQNTSRGSIAHARQQLDQVNANVVGAVLNNFDPSSARAQPYYYQYSYQYRYEQPPSEREAPARGRRGRRGRRLALPADAADREWSA